MYNSFFDELTKLAKQTQSPKASTGEKIMRGAVTARPWAQRFVTSGVPAAVAANFFLPMKDSPLKRKLIAGSGLLGGGAGIGELAVRRWAEKHPRKGLAKEIKKMGAAQAFLKVAAMATDLRKAGIGGVERPPMVTEDSKEYAANKLQQSSKPGEFLSSTKPRHLRAPGPSIQQVSALPTG
jgi:hypothetical protein